MHSRVSSFQVALAPSSAVLRLASPRPPRSNLARTDGVFRYVRLPRRVERSSSQDRLFEAELRGHLIETAWNGITVRNGTYSGPIFYRPIVSYLLLLSRPPGRLLSLCAVTASARDHSLDSGYMDC